MTRRKKRRWFDYSDDDPRIRLAIPFALALIVSLFALAVWWWH